MLSPSLEETFLSSVGQVTLTTVYLVLVKILMIKPGLQVEAQVVTQVLFHPNASPLLWELILEAVLGHQQLAMVFWVLNLLRNAAHLEEESTVCLATQCPKTQL